MPVGNFYYNPGVQDQRAAIFQNSNQMMGQMLVGLLDRMGQAKAQQQQKTEALTHDAKAAQSTFNADVAEAGEDKNAMTSVLQRWGVSSPGEFKLLSAQDQKARADGVISAETLLKYARENAQAKADTAGSALIPGLMAKANDIQTKTPTTYNGFTGQQNPPMSFTAALTSALKTLSPADQQTLGKSRPAQEFLRQATTTGDRDATSIAREQMIYNSQQAGRDQRESQFQQREQRLTQNHQDNVNIANQKLKDVEQLRANRGKVTDQDVYRGLRTARDAVVKAQASADMMKDDKTSSKLAAKLAEIDTQMDALVAGKQAGPAPSGAGVPTITSQADYDKLAVGSQYMDSTGKTFTKRAAQ